MFYFLATLTDYMGLFLYYVLIAVRVYTYIMFAYILLSWTPLVKSKIYAILGKVCDPYLNIFRGRLIFGNMDFGPLFGILMLNLLGYIIQNALF